MRLLVEALPTLQFLLPETEWSGAYDQLHIERGSSVDGPFVPVTAASAASATLSFPVETAYDVSGETLGLLVGTTSVNITFSGTTLSAVLSTITAAAPGLIVASSTGDTAYIRTVASGSQTKLSVVGGTAVPILGLLAGDVRYGVDAYKALVSGTELYTMTDAFATEGSFYRMQYRDGLSWSAWYGPLPSAPNLLVPVSAMSIGTIQVADIQGKPSAGLRVSVRYLYGSVVGVQPPSETFYAFTDTQGRVSFQLVRGLVVQMVVEGTSMVRSVLVPNLSTFDMMDSAYVYGSDPWSVAIPDFQPASPRGV